MTATPCAALAASLALSACGGSSTVKPAAYTKSVCTSIAAFEQNLRTADTTLNSSLSTTSSLAQAKQALQTFLSTAVSESSKVVSGLKSAGTPDVSNGKQISTALSGTFTRFKNAMTQAAASAEQIPTSSPQAFKTATASIKSDMDTSLSGIGSGLTGLKSSQLGAAARQEPACTQIGSS